MLSKKARQQAQAEGLMLRVAENTAGYFGVCIAHPGKPKPYKAEVRRGGKQVHLGSFATAEEAALCVARSPEGQVAAQRVAAAPIPLTSWEARQQAQAERLTLRVADNKAGYLGVRLDQRNKFKPYQARVTRGGKTVSLGCFTTAEEAALHVARSPEGQAAAQRAAAAPPPLTGDDDGGDDTGEEGEEETVEVLDAVEVVLVASDEMLRRRSFDARRGKEAREGEHGASAKRSLKIALYRRGCRAAVEVQVGTDRRVAKSSVSGQCAAAPRAPAAQRLKQNIQKIINASRFAIYCSKGATTRARHFIEKVTAVDYFYSSESHGFSVPRHRRPNWAPPFRRRPARSRRASATRSASHRCASPASGAQSSRACAPG
eukprot:scaffold30250_cov50-Phaeocystis_antarctica.AAC.2